MRRFGERALARGRAVCGFGPARAHGPLARVAVAAVAVLALVGYSDCDDPERSEVSCPREVWLLDQDHDVANQSSGFVYIWRLEDLTDGGADAEPEVLDLYAGAQEYAREHGLARPVEARLWHVLASSRADDARCAPAPTLAVSAVQSRHIGFLRARTRRFVGLLDLAAWAEAVGAPEPHPHAVAVSPTRENALVADNRSGSLIKLATDFDEDRYEVESFVNVFATPLAEVATFSAAPPDDVEAYLWASLPQDADGLDGLVVADVLGGGSPNFVAYSADGELAFVPTFGAAAGGLIVVRVGGPGEPMRIEHVYPRHLAPMSGM
jgi:hypothetical protein